MSKIHYSKGCFTKEHIDEYIKNSMSDKQYKIFINLWNDTKEEHIEFKSIGVSNANGYTYNELFLFDVGCENGKYMPVYVQNINTSSPYALMRLETDYDNEDDNFMSIEELKDMIMKGYDVIKICNLVMK